MQGREIVSDRVRFVPILLVDIFVDDDSEVQSLCDAS